MCGQRGRVVQLRRQGRPMQAGPWPEALVGSGCASIHHRAWPTHRPCRGLILRREAVTGHCVEWGVGVGLGAGMRCVARRGARAISGCDCPWVLETGQPAPAKRGEGSACDSLCPRCLRGMGALLCCAPGVLAERDGGHAPRVAACTPPRVFGRLLLLRPHMHSARPMRSVGGNSRGLDC